MYHKVDFLDSSEIYIISLRNHASPYMATICFILFASNFVYCHVKYMFIDKIKH